MSQSSISIDIDDPRTGLVAEALANKTCVKILGLLAEADLTAVDIAGKLGAPLNTTGYNLDKLVRAGLIEKATDFFWSVKGKKMPTYRVANKRIIISPKRLVKGVVPAVIASGIATMIVRSLIRPQAATVAETSMKLAADSGAAEAARSFAATAPIMSAQTTVGASSVFHEVWPWFFIGAVFSLLIFFLWNWIGYQRRFK